MTTPIQSSKQPTLQTVCIAQPTTLGKNSVPSGINKISVSGPVSVTELGLEGDFQADRRVHGGLEKAVYQFPKENYQSLSEALPHLKEKFSSPCLGENFSTIGMTDESVFIGDIYKVGSTLLQVSQPRMPCWKVNQHIGNAHMMALLIALEASGWYYRVLEPGKVETGNTFSLVERIQHDYSVSKVWELWGDLREKKVASSTPIHINGLSDEWTFQWE